MGGGICTALALTPVFTIGWFEVFVGSLVMLIFRSLLAAVVIVCSRRARRQISAVSRMVFGVSQDGSRWDR